MSSPYQYSFSGADAKMYAHFPSNPSKVTRLDCMHTVSFSVFEAKAPVRALGYRGVKGFTRSIRTIGGSMITLVVSDHPFKPLLEQIPDLPRQIYGWSMDNGVNGIGIGTAFDSTEYRHRLPTLMPPFNLQMTYVSELAQMGDSPSWVGSGETGAPDPVYEYLVNGGARPYRPMDYASAMLEGVEFISDGTVTSINDSVTEITFQFVARNYHPIVFNKVPTTVPKRTVVEDPAFAKAIKLADEARMMGDRAGLGWDKVLGEGTDFENLGNPEDGDF